jgi:hypothetical protein
MQDNTEMPPGVRVMCDGGREPHTVQKTAVADAVVTREVDGDEQEMVRVPISSTRADREGDRFTKEALEGMADQIRAENPMVFDNHGLAGSWMEAIPYDSRETIGAQMDAELESAEDGEWDLYALVNPDGTHPEGERMLGQVRDEGQPVKFSVGFRVLDYDAIEDDAGNEIGREFTDSDLMETSRVGIPANPDASVTQSVTAKGGPTDLPGYKNHPMFQMLQAMGHDGTQRDTTGQTVAKDGTQRDAVTSDTVEDGTPVRTDGQGEGEKEDKPKCDSDADCPDGEMCEDGHCVDASEASADVPDLSRDLLDDPDAFERAVDVFGAKAVHDAIKEEGDPCDDNGDCDEGYVCVDGECVPEDDVDDDEESSDVPEAVRELREQNETLREEVAEIRAELSEGRGDAKTGTTEMSGTVPEPDETDEQDEQDTENKTAMDIARDATQNQ